VSRISVEFFNVAAVKNEDDIKDFLDNDDITILAARIQDNVIVYSNDVPVDEDVCLLFYKIPKMERGRQPDGDPQIGLMTLEGGLAKSIYNSLQRVFSPYILKVSELFFFF
jgi:dynein heavy chain 2